MTPGEELRKCFWDCNLSTIEAMNELQDQGVISDMCVWPDDVAESDVKSAINHLRSKYEKNPT